MLKLKNTGIVNIIFVCMSFEVYNENLPTIADGHMGGCGEILSFHQSGLYNSLHFSSVPSVMYFPYYSP